MFTFFSVNVQPVSLNQLLCQTLPITQQLSSTLIFVAVFVRLHRGSLEATQLLFICGLLALIGFSWSKAVGGSGGGTPVIPLIALYALSPALKTLTRATTSDSIWALSGTLLAINLFLGDYRSIPTAENPRSPTQLPSTLVLTTALSASTVLASRLSSNLAVFSLLLFSTIWFGPFPVLRSALPTRPTVFLSILLAAGAIISLIGVGGGAAKIAAVAISGIAIGAPLARGFLRRYKDKIRGPWDQAIPVVEIS